MGIAALVTWLVTAVGGFVLLGTWLARGGHRSGSASRLAPPLVFGHALLAVVGLGLWIAYLFAESAALAWVAFLVLLLVATLGFAMLVRWLTSRGDPGAAESRFPVPVIAGHGLFAATTLVLVFLTALGAG
jgi:hypothetical protein